MKKQFEHFLLSILLGTSILLVLTFWLNIKFGFNCLSIEHWNQLASLQATQAPIDKNFYLSIGVAIVAFILGLNIIFHPTYRKIPKMKQIVPEKTETPILKPEPEKPIIQPPAPQIQAEPVKPQTETSQITPPTTTNVPTGINLVRPPKLNLPKNFAQIAAAHNAQRTAQEQQANQSERYDTEIAKIFTDNNYVVQKNATISGIKTNLFALGNNEKLWLGYVDGDMNKAKNVINKIKDVISETLEDVEIYINAFMLDTRGVYESDDEVMIFRSIQDLNEYIQKHPGEEIQDFERENFQAYSEYIDTVITMLYKM